MTSQFWAKAHGATTHLPVALVGCSAAFEGLALLLRGRPVARDLRVAAFWTLLVAAAGAFPAVLSGLVMTRGSVIGHDALRWHHLFGWPAFGLLVALGTWRLVFGPSRIAEVHAGYLVLVTLAAGLTAAAAYWGGEMMIAR